MDLKTSFNILGLDPEADEASAKRAYKAKVRRWHPDQFPEGSDTKDGAEEHLKQINIAYARVKAHVAGNRHAPGVTPRPPHSPRDTARREATTDEQAEKRSWVDHLFDTLNAFAGKREGQPTEPAADQADAIRQKTFGQVLDEMAGGSISIKPKRQPGGPAAAQRRAAAYRRYRSRGSTVGGVGGTESPGPVKPVSRVRGIGRSR
jgi:curved DNA-binding protein CbpA